MPKTPNTPAAPRGKVRLDRLIGLGGAVSK